MRTGTVKNILAGVCISIMMPSMAAAQTTSACDTMQIDDPPRIVYRCGNGLILEAEAAAELEVESSSDQARPDSVQLDSDAALIEVTPGTGPFQILTPHAIAAVRGTIYVVDVQDDKTSVFVMRGEVEVSRPDGTERVILPPGYGIEIGDDAAPFDPKIWPQEKVSRLMARFAR